MAFREAPRIIGIKEFLFTLDLQIPPYQRPYKWTVRNVNQLVDDLLSYRHLPAYRLGTVVMHKEGDKSACNIVDGQQRALTLTLIAHAIIEHRKEALQSANLEINADQEHLKLLSTTFASDISRNNIQKNYREIERRIREFDEHVIDFFFTRCELVYIVLSEISEAFQFFDSQNSRGKDLAPHDLLKAYHLREMADLPDNEKFECVAKWESMRTETLAALFETYLFRIRSWSMGNSARYFSKNDIDAFKGITITDEKVYPFTKLPRIGHQYADQHPVEVNSPGYPFQLDQVIINGKRFFEMISHYEMMIDKIHAIPLDASAIPGGNTALLKAIFTALEKYENSERIGDNRTRELFDCCLIYYHDKFGMHDISKAIEKLFIWSYSLRLKLYSIQLASVDNYVLQYNLFKTIREAIHPAQITNIDLNAPSENRATKTEDIVELFKSLNYYSGI